MTSYFIGGAAFAENMPEGSNSPKKHLSKTWKPSLGQGIFKGLRGKVTIGVVLPLALILSAFTVLDYISTRQQLVENLSTVAGFSARIIESSIRHGMVDNDTAAIQEMLDSVAKENDFDLLYILKPSGEIIYSARQESIGLVLDTSQDDCRSCHSLPADQRPGSIVVVSKTGQEVFRSMQPILNGPDCFACHDSENRIVGVLLTDINTGKYSNTLLNQTRRNLILWGALILVTILIVYFSLDIFVIRGLKQMAVEMKDITKGSRRRRQTKQIQRKDEIGQLESSLYSMVDELELRQAENEALAGRLTQQNKQRKELLSRVISAQEDERKRLSRDLHDDLGQTLGGFALLIERVDELIQEDPDQARSQLALMRKQINNTSERMYELIMDLRPAILDDLGLVSALKLLADRVMENSGIIFNLDDDHFSSRISPDVEINVYRVIQEAISNCLKHASATALNVKLSCANGYFTCEIWDDGRGFDFSILSPGEGSSENYGILGMQERIAQCGGTFELSSHPGSGTQIRFDIPLKEDCCA